MMMDPLPFDWIAGPEDAPVLLLCDHASAAIPAALDSLHLGTAERFSHIAWDIGAAELTLQMAERLHCPALLGGVSRLVVDLNRAPDDAAVIPVASGGVAISANADLSTAQRKQRLDCWHTPYHQRIAAYLNQHPACRAVIGLHSFTAHLAPASPRPWHVGVLWRQDGRLALPLLDGLRQQTGLVVGDNQPYSAHELNYTLDTHAATRGLAAVAVEIRQDMLCSSAMVRWWAAELAALLDPLVQGLFCHD